MEERSLLFFLMLFIIVCYFFIDLKSVDRLSLPVHQRDNFCKQIVELE